MEPSNQMLQVVDLALDDLFQEGAAATYLCAAATFLVAAPTYLSAAATYLMDCLKIRLISAQLKLKMS